MSNGYTKPQIIAELEKCSKNMSTLYAQKFIIDFNHFFILRTIKKH